MTTSRPPRPSLPAASAMLSETGYAYLCGCQVTNNGFFRDSTGAKSHGRLALSCLLLAVSSWALPGGIMEPC